MKEFESPHYSQNLHQIVLNPHLLRLDFLGYQMAAQTTENMHRHVGYYHIII